jgi:hypothetical protein
VTSFVNHPWIFRDAETHTKLVCGSREVFDCPEVKLKKMSNFTSLGIKMTLIWYFNFFFIQPKYIKIKDGAIKATRVVVGITVPLYSLRECAMQAIQRLIRSPEDVLALEIPSVLRQELQSLCSVKTAVAHRI